MVTHYWVSPKGYYYKYTPQKKVRRISEDAYNSKPWYPQKANKVYYYCTKDRKYKKAVVVDVHYDDKIPFYTIKVDEKEKQTELNRLKPRDV